MRISILGVPVDAVMRTEALEKVRAAFVAKNKPYFVVTPNPEFVVLAQKDKEFMDVLNQADLAIPDGIGLLWAAKLQGQSLPERVAGSDLTVDVCRWAAEEGKTAYLLGGVPGMAEKAAVTLEKMFPGLKIVGIDQGGRLYWNDRAGEWQFDDQEAIKCLIEAKPDILLAGLPFGRQEKWLLQAKRQMPWLGLMMGVGGTFEFLGGKISRAPLWLRRIGLEWLWRLVLQPSRWRRIVRAVIVFPLLVIRAKF